MASRVFLTNKNKILRGKDVKISIEININNKKQNSNYAHMEHNRRVAYLESLRPKTPIPPRIIIRYGM